MAANDDVQPRDPALAPPTGVAAVRGFSSDSELVAALMGLVRAALGPAIERRERSGLITGRGDVASTLVLDGERARALLANRRLAPVDAGPLPRIERSLLVRLEATGDSGPPLARGLSRWRLDAGAILVLAAALAAALDPALSRLLVYLGGDPARPHLSLEAAAAMLGDGPDAVLAVERMLAPGASLERLGLVDVGRPDMPALRRSIEASPRLLSLAAGARDGASPRLARVAPGQRFEAVLDEADAGAIRAVAARRDGRLAWVLGARGVERELARVLATDGVDLLRLELGPLDRPLERALIRESELAGAAIAIATWERRPPVSENQRLAAALDRLAPEVPIYLLGEAAIDLPLSSRQVVVSTRPATEAPAARPWEAEFPPRSVARARAALASWADTPDRPHIALVCGDLEPAQRFVSALAAERGRTTRELGLEPAPIEPNEIAVIASPKLDFGGRYELERLINRLVGGAGTAFVVYGGPRNPSHAQLVDLVLELKTPEGDRRMREAFNLDIL